MFSFLQRAPVWRKNFPQNVIILQQTFSNSFSSQKAPSALRSKKAKSTRPDVSWVYLRDLVRKWGIFDWFRQTTHFVDTKQIRALGGKGGNGAISFLSLWANENAGPDGGDGGNGGHVVLEVSRLGKSFRETGVYPDCFYCRHRSL